MRASFVLAFVVACGFSAGMAACGSTTSTPGSDPAAPGPQNDPPATGEDPPATTPAAAYPADHPPLPQVANNGGPVLKTPKIVPVVFPGFSFKNEVVDLAAKMGKSAYWKAVTSEYGVGPLEAVAAIDVAEAAPTVLPDADIQAWLVSRFDGTHPEFGTTPVEGAIYTLYYPASTTIYLGKAPTPSDGGVADSGDGGRPRGQSQASCRAFGGYHQDVSVNGVPVAYAVIPQCATFGPLSGADVVTATSSHELVEAATDPYPISNPAYSMVDDAHLVWTYVLGAGETADMCAQYDSSFYRDDEIGYSVQRSWSNAAAKAGSEPCVPAPANAQPYFNAAPVLTDNIQFSLGDTKGVRVPVGQSKTIELDLFSSGATKGPWNVSVTAAGAGGQTPPVTFALDKDNGQNGDKINLTVTSQAAASSRIGGVMFIVTSQLGDQKHYWAGVVGN